MKPILLTIIIVFILVACNSQSESSNSELTATMNSQRPTKENPGGNIADSIDKQQPEYLVAWGRKKWPNGDCNFLTLNPISKNLVQSVPNTPWCNFEIMTNASSQELISFPPFLPTDTTQSSIIIFYDINELGFLSEKRTIILEGLKLTSTPQRGINNVIFFSAIENGYESIYSYDINSGISSQLITAKTGFATNPLVSPDGHFIAYQVWEDHDNREQCGRSTCFSRSLFVRDLESNEDINVTNQVKSITTTDSIILPCNEEWSLSDNLLAFETGGCGVQTPSSVVVFSPDKREVVSVLDSYSESLSVVKFHWIREKQLILAGAIRIIDTSDLSDGYLIYSAETNTLREMSGLPSRNVFDYDAVMFSHWTNDGKFAVGQTQVSGPKRNTNIVIANSWDESVEEIYIQSTGEFVDNPIWSPANDMIAYRSYNWESKESESNFTIIDASGLPLFDTGSIQLVYPKFQWYSNSIQ